jgi:uncharacterized membrane protein YhaH (DUF805 family)
MNFPKKTLGHWIGVAVGAVSGFFVMISDNPLVSFFGIPIIIGIASLFGLTVALLTRDSSKRKAAAAQIKRNLSDKRFPIRVLLRLGSMVLWILWPIALAFNFITLGWKARSFLFSFRGRASRKTYWDTLFIYFAWAIATWLAYAVIVGLTQRDTGEGVAQFAYYPMLIAVFGPIIASAPAIGMKRLHDINKSGWWLLLFYLVPVACLGLFNFTGISQSTRGFLLIFLFFPVTVWALIELGCRRGTRGQNKYGIESLL